MAAVTNNGWKVEVTGLREIIDALGEVDKTAQKEVTKFITEGAKRVANVAKGRIGSRPMSNWGPWFYSKNGRDLGFEPSSVASGIKVRRNNFRRRGVSAGIGWDVVQGNAAGAIYEIIGSGSRIGETPYYWQGSQFVNNVVNKGGSGPTPRNLYPAYYSVMNDGLQDDIRDTIIAAAHRAGLK